MSFNDIALELLRKQNCAVVVTGYIDGWVGKGEYIANLHRFVQDDVSIINQCKNPREDFQCKELKKKQLFILENFNTFKHYRINSGR